MNTINTPKLNKTLSNARFLFGMHFSFGAGVRVRIAVVIGA